MLFTLFPKNMKFILRAYIVDITISRWYNFVTTIRGVIKMETIKTDRLVLRQPQESDKNLLFALLNDIKVHEFISHIYCETLSEVDEFLFLSHFSDFKSDFCFILESKETKEIIGLIEAYVTSDNILCVSYATKKSARGKGFICEA